MSVRFSPSRTFFALALSFLLTVPVHAEIVLTPVQLERLASHGPWPSETRTDPSNRVSGNSQAIALGKRLFFAEGMASDLSVSCASCHQPANGLTDGLPRAQGRRELDRNTPALFNLKFQRWFGWDGRNDNLWAQSVEAITNPDEFAVPPDAMNALVFKLDISNEYNSLFGDIESHSDELILINLGKALAAYQETLVTGPTPFDLFRDAVSIGDFDAAATYPEAAQRGFALFTGSANCSTCHTGPLFSNGEFHDAGVPYFIEAGRVDPGRHLGRERVRNSPRNLAGIYSDDAEKSGAWAVQRLRFQHADFGRFRVPGLRNVALTAPYMHAGSLATLEDVVNHYSNIDLERLHADGESILQPLDLSRQQVADLVAFLNSLTSQDRLFD